MYYIVASFTENNTYLMNKKTVLYDRTRPGQEIHS